jgi:hypothetical protein
MSAPALAWWHMEQELSVAQGVERAVSILSAIPAPPHKRPPGAQHDLSPAENKVWLTTTDFRIVVKLLPRGGSRSLTVIIVAGQQQGATLGTMELIRETMKTGNLGALLE